MKLPGEPDTIELGRDASITVEKKPRTIELTIRHRWINAPLHLSLTMEQAAVIIQELSSAMLTNPPAA